MGAPVNWDYVLRISPEEQHMHVFLYRWQREHTTRFLWLQTTMPNIIERAEQDQVLQGLYTAVVELISMTE